MKNGKKHFYLVRDGKCIYTYKEYNDNDLDFESNIKLSLRYECL